MTVNVITCIHNIIYVGLSLTFVMLIHILQSHECNINYLSNGNPGHSFFKLQFSLLPLYTAF